MNRGEMETPEATAERICPGAAPDTVSLLAACIRARDEQIRVALLSEAGVEFPIGPEGYDLGVFAADRYKKALCAFAAKLGTGAMPLEAQTMRPPGADLVGEGSRGDPPSNFGTGRRALATTLSEATTKILLDLLTEAVSDAEQEESDRTWRLAQIDEALPRARRRAAVLRREREAARGTLMASEMRARELRWARRGRGSEEGEPDVSEEKTMATKRGERKRFHERCQGPRHE